MNPHYSPPSRLLGVLESRFVLELGLYGLARPWLKIFPKGDGHPVMVIPGFIAGDVTTVVIRQGLQQCGYVVQGWQEGLNRGMPPKIQCRLIQRIRKLAETSHHKVSLVGWSLGGVLARELARQQPEIIRGVITLGSPLQGNSQSTRFLKKAPLLEIPQSFPEILDSFPWRHLPPPVPTTAIYTRFDGIVDWHCSQESLQPQVENIEVPSSHYGLGFNPLVLYVIADRLSQPENHWRPFDYTGWRQYVYRAGDSFRERKF